MYSLDGDSNRFVDQIRSHYVVDLWDAFNLYAGTVLESAGLDGSSSYVIESYDKDIERMFSIGLPLFDGDDHLLGYLGIGMSSETYEGEVPLLHAEVPKERWQICQPTQYCKAGVEIKTYWKLIAATLFKNSKCGNCTMFEYHKCRLGFENFDYDNPICLYGRISIKHLEDSTCN